MRVVLALLACTVGCGFQTSSAVVDASDATRPPDAAIDGGVLPDSSTVARTRDGLIGLWELDEPAGAKTIADTSDAAKKVPLTITGSVAFANGTMTTSAVAEILSAPKPHLNQDVIDSGAVTLEAWVTPALGEQGVTRPYVVVGLSPSIMARNISLMQAGTHWLARVRIGTATTDRNGEPDLIANAPVKAGELAHLVVVCDATQRILYVNGKPVAEGPVPGPPRGWDTDYRILFGKEYNTIDEWMGSFSLVAMYRRALSAAEVKANFDAGPGDP